MVLVTLISFYLVCSNVCQLDSYCNSSCGHCVSGYHFGSFNSKQLKGNWHNIIWSLYYQQGPQHCSHKHENKTQKLLKERNNHKGTMKWKRERLKNESIYQSISYLKPTSITYFICGIVNIMPHFSIRSSICGSYSVGKKNGI